MSIEILPHGIRSKYEIHERKHACAILQNDFPNEWRDIVQVLDAFELKNSYITTPGGRKSQVSEFIDNSLYQRGWVERHFNTSVVVDGYHRESPTHDIDCYRNRVALEIEWNNKDPFYDRDLNNFRLLHELDVISVGVIITRCTELQQIFNDIGRGASYGSSTTHMGKLMPKVNGGGSGGCPLLIFGISPALYNPCA
ncbi:BglII/BstYI family type II restriction endonuclease [Endozoicomonas euniceicola]|uniref:Restriction endonuclease n=1 Tax=Endozoicomonas euniceicola TaxID=1234143 RepID=A0ABY6GZ49_9GAMM|nr:BglII/BstYI family type II restriction endonuclease [Endozoicomonas euniceicola]UYM18078.1 hypothetical protein NX720_09285 [Endozoicomonas euniceicola]